MKGLRAFQFTVVCITFALFSCSAAQQTQSLPTIAILPTNTYLPVSTATPTPFQVPTATQPHKLTDIEMQLTSSFSDPTLRKDVIENFYPIGFENGTPDPTQVAERIEGRAYGKLFFDIVKREMPITDVESKLLGGQAGNEGIWFKYEYISPAQGLDVMQNVPALLCGFQEAGLIEQKITFSIEQNRSEKNPYQGHLFCILPEDIKSLNCATPKQIDVEAIQTSPGCRV